LKSTFITTDLNSKNVKKNKDLDNDALLQDLEGNLSDDSEYNPNKVDNGEEKAKSAKSDEYMKSDEEDHWDDEENFVVKKDKSMSASLISDGDIADAIKSSSEEA
jgi:hypothetical protein